MSKTITVQTYSTEQKVVWDTFCNSAKTSTFLFQRDFMEYHASRFEDYSLLFFERDKLIAVLPAHKDGATVYSHNGLTYGGLVLKEDIKLETSLLVIEALLKHLHKHHIKKLQFKLLPKYYHKFPSDELVYALFLAEAELTGTEVSSVIKNPSVLNIQSNRLEGVKKAETHHLSIKEETDFEAFWNTLLIPQLETQFQTTPVHSLAEIKQLAKNFPKHIRLFNVYNNQELVAGTVIFETEQVAHTQYIASNSERQQLGSVDFLFANLLTKQFRDKPYFSFGTSNANNGRELNTGLNYWKECFGARSYVHQTYTVDTSKYSLVKSALL